MSYNNLFKTAISKLKTNGNYRIFNYINREVGTFPQGKYNNKNISFFCSNDYLNMAHDKSVINTIKKTVEKHGCGAGGTRNISGSNNFHKQLETMIGEQHNKKALLFPSCYIANYSVFSTIKHLIPNCHIFSDEKNHASIILGIKNVGLNKSIFQHNNIDDLFKKIKKIDPSIPKLIVFESVYSMSGNIAPIEEFIDISKRYNALTFVDEVHAIGLYGTGGRGIVNKLHLEENIDILSGTLGKAYGLSGGYISANETIIDCIRSYSPEFIFTTAPPPSLCTGAMQSINIVQSKQGDIKREILFNNITYLKSELERVNINILKTGYNDDTHIICIVIGDTNKCREVSNILLQEYNIYIQPINYPTVSVGEEVLRITLSPSHTYRDIDYLVDSLKKMDISHYISHSHNSHNSN